MRDRIVDLRRVAASELRTHPANWREHPPAQRQALAEMLDRLGIVDAVIARETPAGLELIDGHLRADIAADDILPVLVVDLDDAEAAEALATLDPLAAMASTDTAALRALVDGLDEAPPIPYAEIYGAAASNLPRAVHTPTDQLQPPVRIYGSKIRSARLIVAALPDDDAGYVEPFAGALAVLLARPAVRNEIANDLNGDIISFWEVVRDHTAELARRCAATPSARQEFVACAERLAAGNFEDPIERARCFAVAASQSFASKGVSAANPTNWRRHMLGGTGDWQRTQTADWFAVAERLAHLQLENVNGIRLIETVPPPVVIYCDPPYAITSDTSPYATCDTAGLETAAINAAARGCRVAVSGYHGDWPEIAALWNRVEWLAGTGPMGASKLLNRTEVLWMSYEPDADRLAEVGITEIGAPS